MFAVVVHAENQDNELSANNFNTNRKPYPLLYGLKVHKIENFFGSEFEFYTISLLVMLKY